MARDSKETREIKIKALNEAVNILKVESSPTSNKLTYDNLVALANELIEGKSDSKISDSSIKRPTSNEFEQIKKAIEDFRDENKKIKSATPKKAIQESTKLKREIEQLVSHVALFYDDKLLLNEKLEAKERTINKQKKEIKKLQAEIERLRG